MNNMNHSIEHYGQKNYYLYEKKNQIKIQLRMLIIFQLKIIKKEYPIK